MDPFLSLQGDDQDPIINFTLSPPEPLISDSFDAAPVVQIQSTFETYERTNALIQQPSNVNSNMHKRLFGFRTEPAIREKNEQCVDNVEGTRGFRHMMRERIRRERMSQAYADLHSLLASSSLKGDKYTIVKTATRYVEELKNKKERLQKRHEELQSTCNKTTTDGVIIIELQISVNEFTSFDSLALVIRCFKLMNFKILSFRSDFSDGDLLVTVGVENDQMFTKDELHKIVMSRLVETEKQICELFSLQTKWCLSCHVK